MNAEISETIKAELLRFGVQTPELLTYWDMACRFLSFLRSANLFQQRATPTLRRFGVKIPDLLTQRKFVSVRFGVLPELLTQRKFVSASELLTQRKFVSVDCYHAHLNAHKPRKPVTPT